MLQSTDKCTRCGSAIECNPNGIESCLCSTVKLSKGTIAFLSTTAHKCLCNQCLLHFENLVTTSTKLSFPANRWQQQEGLHYYIQNGRFVFTEMYHLLRGECCGNGCTNCVYGYKNCKVV